MNFVILQPQTGFHGSTAPEKCYEKKVVDEILGRLGGVPIIKADDGSKAVIPVEVMWSLDELFTRETWIGNHLDLNLLQGIRSGRFKLMIWQERAEGLTLRRMQGLMQWMAWNRLPLQNLIFVTTNLVSRHCPFERIIVMPAEARVKALHSAMAEARPECWINEDEANQAKPYKILCLNRRMYHHRIAWLSEAYHRDWFDHFIWSAGSTDALSYHWARHWFGIRHLPHEKPNLMAAHPLDGDLKREPTAYTPQPKWPWLQSGITLVTESVMESSDCQSLTHATFQTLAQGHPFIILGGPGVLARLRGLGYETFGSIWDESYDQIPDRNDRFQVVMRLVQSIIDNPTLMDQARPIAVRNLAHFHARDSAAEIRNLVSRIGSLWVR